MSTNANKEKAETLARLMTRVREAELEVYRPEFSNSENWIVKRYGLAKRDDGLFFKFHVQTYSLHDARKELTTLASNKLADISHVVCFLGDE